MNRKRESDQEFEHPLFRALVLMGGSLALGCGGSAVLDGNAGGAPAGGAASGGAATVAGSGGTLTLAGGSGGSGNITPGGASAFDAGVDDCPPAQWDCTGLGPTCEPSLGSGGRPAGCVCDPKRPKSVADCAADQDIVCLRAYSTEPDPNTWDTAVHVQCACVPGPHVPTSSTCANACSMAYGIDGGGEYYASCSVPSGTTCDSSGGNCTATSADVLRQDGIVCGCAPVILK